MTKQRNRLLFGLLAAGVLVGALLILTSVRSAWSNGKAEAGLAGAGGGSSATSGGTSIAAATIAPSSGGRFKYGSTNLVGASDAEIAQFAQDWVLHRLQPKGTPEVLLARSISYDEISVLGLGCPPAFNTIEEPPLMLAIVRGEFDFRGAEPGFRNEAPPIAGQKRYVVYIFDAWAGRPAVTIASEDGAIVKKALQDPTLPNNPAEAVAGDCPTPIPVAQRRLHYGQPAPGFTVPPQPTPQFPSGNTPAAPPPVATPAESQLPTSVPTKP